MNVLELRKNIQTFLLTKATRVYYKRPPSNAQYPYVVFTLVDSIDGNRLREDFDLEIDIWDDSSNLTALETLVGSIDGDGDLSSPTGLHYRLFYSAGNVGYSAYRERRLDITDEDDRIEHRQLQYRVKAYLLS